ncbi:glutathione S-transferase family protein [Pseudohalioglobus sediminis]|uniref:Glutathione S-transferase family protein n=1 Tax=Pseudohalioglobus sediminis TaxID=2606449 RepID=A0A5B0X177_9GAMM|nr:glutathione S-transferase family protein [Pseudohalioglobus sediminis]KAA1192405.1 glutathione S-transferase family protein [Pseudohalioglobus sediminis]
MAEVILHQYELSPFGTAMRLALGLKGIPWKSVEAPMVSPKPDLSALTGGYERIPVLQIGADIYCDTDCITSALEAYAPEPTLYPQPLGLAGKFIAQWAGNCWFMPAAGTALGGNADSLPEEFWLDREKRFGMDRKTFLPAVPHMQSQFAAGAQYLVAALADGRDFIAGDTVGHADLTLYMIVRFVQLSGIQPADLSAAVAEWYQRVEAIGWGDLESWTAEQAIQHALENTPVDACAVAPGQGWEAGQRVSVRTESPDPAAVEGTLVGLDDARISIARDDPKAGLVHVHFPRMGQILTPA